MAVRTSFTIRLSEAESLLIQSISKKNQISVNRQIRLLLQDGILWRDRILPELRHTADAVESIQARLGIPCQKLFQFGGL